MKPEEMVGQRIAEIRERLGMTQQQLGELLEPLLGKAWPRQTVSSAEKGKRAFTAAELIALAIVLRTQANRLLIAPIEMEELEMPGGTFVGRDTLSAVLGYRPLPARRSTPSVKPQASPPSGCGPTRCSWTS